MSQASPNDRFATLEGCRGLACAAVVVYHCGVAIRWPPIYAFGFAGVHFFFVLSGFLLYRPFAAAMLDDRPLPSARNYLARRLIRIVPPYWVALIVFTALRAVSRAPLPGVWDFIAHALLLFNFDPRINFYGINGVFWSLAIEVQFYLLLPVIAFAANRFAPRRWNVWASPAICFAAGVVCRCVEVAVVSDHYRNGIDHVAIRSVFSYLDLFAFGMAATVVELRWRGAEARPSRFGLLRRHGLLAVGLALFFLANAWSAHGEAGGWQSKTSLFFAAAFCPLLCAGLTAILLWVVWSPPTALTFLRSQPLSGLGVISYSLYLYHAGVQFFVFKLNIGHAWSWNAMTVTNALISLPLASAVAVVMYLAVEAPSLAWVSRIRSRCCRAVRPTADEPVALLGP